MRRSRLAVAVAVAVSTGSVMLAQEPEPAAAPESRVDAVFAPWDTTTSPGCAISVVRGGEIVYARGYGMANLDHDVPIRPDTVFHVASLSKQFTAAAIALLALEGKLSLDDPIQEHLTWVPDFGHPIVIRNLVHHNSGMRDQWSLLGMAGWRYSRDRITNDDVVYLIERQRDLNFPPGERYLYSNTGYTLMGQIVEAVSGQSLREFTTEWIFEPLGMSRTHFRDDFSEIVKDQAFGYRRDDDTAAFHLSVTNFDTVGATSLLTTVEDLARWDRNFVDPVVGGPGFLDLIHQRGTLTGGETQDYAFGLSHGTYRGLATVGHGGSDAGYRADFVRFPDHGLSVAALCNLAQTNPGRLAREVAAVYLEDHLDPVEAEATADVTPVSLRDAAQARLEGAYWSDRFGTVYRVLRQEDGLQFRIGQQRPDAMIHTGDGRFELSEASRAIRFEPADGAVERLVTWPVGEPEGAESIERLAPFESSLGDFAGDYASPELPVTYHLVLEQGVLSLSWLKRSAVELTPVAADVLIGDAGSLRFRRDATGHVEGFVLEAGRIRNFRFDRIR